MNTNIRKWLLLSGIALLATTARAQEMAPASASKLANVALPNGALRVTARTVPRELTQALEAIVKAGGPEVRRGQTEVLAWAGGNYKLSRAPQYKKQIGAKLKAAGWEYEEGAKIDDADGTTMVTALKATPNRKALIGFWAPSKDALVLAWTEMLPAKPKSGSKAKTAPKPSAAPKPNTAPKPSETPSPTPTLTPAPDAP
ncbi:MAG TPA: hypothetical protein VGB45_00230 [Abditibacterium sp.]